jgi:hypothetical protein
MNIRIIAFSCLSFGLIHGCFGLNSILNTAERNTAANALVARDAQELKALYTKASKIAKANAISHKVLTPAAVPFGIVGTALPISYFVIAGKRARMYERFAKHADLIFALLHNADFKKHMGVTDWGKVRKVRRTAESAGISAQFVGTVPLAVFSTIAAGVAGGGIARAARLERDQAQTLVNGFLLSGLGTGLGLGAFGLKPIIAKAIRKKGGAPDLENELIKIIDTYERTGFVPYDVTAPNNVSDGTTASTTYAGSGMQSTVYAAESARDRYLRLLAERQAAKESQASE